MAIQFTNLFNPRPDNPFNDLMEQPGVSQLIIAFDRAARETAEAEGARLVRIAQIVKTHLEPNRNKEIRTIALVKAAEQAIENYLYLAEVIANFIPSGAYKNPLLEKIQAAQNSH